MSVRGDILAAVRRGTATKSAPPPAAAAAPFADPAAEFVRRATEASASVSVVAALDLVPQAVADFLARNALPGRVRVGSPLRDLAWDAVPGLAVQAGTPAADGETLVTGCLAGVAEFGAVALASGPGHAAESVFLAENHVVVLPRSRLLHRFEDLWQLLAREFPAELPRSVNLILGPSRTADLGVPSRLGAHGPRRMHIILVDGA